ncbi:MAG: MFS transporter [Nitrosomonadales bacterium]|jgi:MFS family permease|nr:MFS transporter [Nitrosomonadales bacterium]
MDMGRTIPATALTPSRFVVLLSAATAVSMAYGVTLPFLPFILERVLQPGQLGAVPWHTGLLTASYTLALFLLSPLWGVLSDRLNRRAVISLGLIGSGASLVLLDNVSNLTMLYASRMLGGIFAAAVLPAVLAYIAEACTASERPRKFAIVASFTSLGFMLGPMVGGWLSSMVLSPSDGMRVVGVLMLDSPFFVIALVSILCALGTVLLSVSHNLPRIAADDQVSPTDKKQIRLALLLTVITVFGVSTAEVGITLLGKQSLLFDPSTISQFFVVCSLVMITVQIGIFPMLMHKFSIQTLLVIAFVLGTLGLGALPYARSIPAIDVLFGMIAAGTGILVPILSSVISAAAGQGQGKAFGQQASAANLGQAIAAASTGALFFAQPGTPFLIAASMLAASAAIVSQWEIS